MDFECEDFYFDDDDYSSTTWSLSEQNRYAPSSHSAQHSDRSFGSSIRITSTFPGTSSGSYSSAESYGQASGVTSIRSSPHQTDRAGFYARSQQASQLDQESRSQLDTGISGSPLLHEGGMSNSSKSHGDSSLDEGGVSDSPQLDERGISDPTRYWESLFDYLLTYSPQLDEGGISSSSQSHGDSSGLDEGGVADLSQSPEGFSQFDPDRLESEIGHVQRMLGLSGSHSRPTPEQQNRDLLEIGQEIVRLISIWCDTKLHDIQGVRATLIVLHSMPAHKTLRRHYVEASEYVVEALDRSGWLEQKNLFWDIVENIIAKWKQIHISRRAWKKPDAKKKYLKLGSLENKHHGSRTDVLSTFPPQFAPNAAKKVCFVLPFMHEEDQSHDDTDILSSENGSVLSSQGTTEPQAGSVNCPDHSGSVDQEGGVPQTSEPSQLPPPMGFSHHQASTGHGSAFGRGEEVSEENFEIVHEFCPLLSPSNPEETRNISNSPNSLGAGVAKLTDPRSIQSSQLGADSKPTLESKDLSLLSTQGITSDKIDKQQERQMLEEGYKTLVSLLSTLRQAEFLEVEMMNTVLLELRSVPVHFKLMELFNIVKEELKAFSALSGSDIHDLHLELSLIISQWDRILVEKGAPKLGKIGTSLDYNRTTEAKHDHVQKSVTSHTSPPSSLLGQVGSVARELCPEISVHMTQDTEWSFRPAGSVNCPAIPVTHKELFANSTSTVDCIGVFRSSLSDGTTEPQSGVALPKISGSVDQEGGDQQASGASQQSSPVVLPRNQAGLGHHCIGACTNHSWSSSHDEEVADQTSALGSVPEEMVHDSPCQNVKDDRGSLRLSEVDGNIQDSTTLAEQSSGKTGWSSFLSGVGGEDQILTHELSIQRHFL